MSSGDYGKPQEEYKEEVLRLSYNVTQARQSLDNAKSRLVDMKIAVKSAEEALDDLLKRGRPLVPVHK